MATHAPREVRRAQILEAALACFAKKGFHAAKMDDIVRACGLSKGAIYWHFKGKNEIFLALFDSFEQAIFAAWDQVDEGNALDALRREGEIVITQVLQTRVFLDAWTEFLRHPKARRRFAKLYRQSRARLAATVGRGIERNEIRACEPDHVAAAFTALVEGFLIQAFADPSYDPRDAWPTAWEVFSRGLANAPNES
jgi:AcrR family transcriptional regulator